MTELSQRITRLTTLRDTELPSLPLALRDLALGQLAIYAAIDSLSTHELDKAVNELARLTNESLTGHTTAIDELAKANIAHSRSAASLLTRIDHLERLTPTNLTEHINRTDADLSTHDRKIDDVDARLHELQDSRGNPHDRIDELVAAVARHTSDPELHVLA